MRAGLKEEAVRQELHQSQRVQTATTLRVDPKLVLTSYVLQCTQQELEQVIDNELAENPALERIQDDAEPLSDEAILRTVAPQELKPSSEDFEYQRCLPPDESMPDWIDLAQSRPCLRDHLTAQLSCTLPPGMHRLAELVVDSLDERGYLPVPVEELALLGETSLEDVELVVDALKACEPAGVGAADLRECLALQLRHPENFEQEIALEILKHHFDDFVVRRTDRIMRRHQVLPEVVAKAFGEILQLTPYPSEGFDASGLAARGTKASGVTPDIAFTLHESGWEISVLGPDPSSLCMNRYYKMRHRELSDSKQHRDERRHLGQYLDRAENFIASLQQRRKTMRKIANYLLEHQAGFISTGSYRFLQPLTKSKMARDLDVHESTVSRATMEKFVQISNGEVVPFEVFFKPALRVQKMIEEILENENPNSPLSDEQIARMLHEKGIDIARRTVNKYRDRNRQLSSRKRRSA